MNKLKTWHVDLVWLVTIVAFASVHFALFPVFGLWSAAALALSAYFVGDALGKLRARVKANGG